MDRNFFLPIAIAATIHSVLFMSGRPTVQPPALPPPHREKPSDIPMMPLDLAEPEKDVMPADPKTPELPTTQELFTSAADAAHAITIPALPTPDLPPGPAISQIPTSWRPATGESSDGRSKLFSIASLDNSPAARFQPAPNYPPDLKPLGMDGQVTVAFSVDTSGKVYNETIVESTHSRFGEESLRAVRKWRFEPGVKEGKRVPFRMVQTFTFALSE